MVNAIDFFMSCVQCMRSLQQPSLSIKFWWAAKSNGQGLHCLGTLGQMSLTHSLKSSIPRPAQGCLFVALWLWEEQHSLCRVNSVNLF